MAVSDGISGKKVYADAAAAHVGLAAPSRTPPAGWASWYVFYSDVTEDHVAEVQRPALGVLAHAHDGVAGVGLLERALDRLRVGGGDLSRPCGAPLRPPHR